MGNKYVFARNINNMGRDGIIDPVNQTLLCLCYEEQAEILLKALNAAPPSDVVYSGEEFAEYANSKAGEIWKENNFESSACRGAYAQGMIDCKYLLSKSQPSPVYREPLFSYIPLEKQFPDKADHWLATDKMQEGKQVFCIIDNEVLGVGRVVRISGKMYFYYSTNEIVNTDGGCINYKDFNRVKWLPLTSQSDKTGEGKEVAMIKLEDAVRIIEDYGNANWKLTEPSLMSECLIKSIKNL